MRPRSIFKTDPLFSFIQRKNNDYFGIVDYSKIIHYAVDNNSKAAGRREEQSVAIRPGSERLLLKRVKAESLVSHQAKAENSEAEHAKSLGPLEPSSQNRFTIQIRLPQNAVSGTPELVSSDALKSDSNIQMSVSGGFEFELAQASELQPMVPEKVVDPVRLLWRSLPSPKRVKESLYLNYFSVLDDLFMLFHRSKKMKQIVSLYNQKVDSRRQFIAIKPRCDVLFAIKDFEMVYGQFVFLVQNQLSPMKNFALQKSKSSRTSFVVKQLVVEPKIDPLALLESEPGFEKFIIELGRKYQQKTANSKHSDEETTKNKIEFCQEFIAEQHDFQKRLEEFEKQQKAIVQERLKGVYKKKLFFELNKPKTNKILVDGPKKHFQNEKSTLLVKNSQMKLTELDEIGSVSSWAESDHHFRGIAEVRRERQNALAN